MNPDYAPDNYSQQGNYTGGVAPPRGADDNYSGSHAGAGGGGYGGSGGDNYSQQGGYGGGAQDAYDRGSERDNYRPVGGVQMYPPPVSVIQLKLILFKRKGLVGLKLQCNSSTRSQLQ